MDTWTTIDSEPSDQISAPDQLLTAYLDYYRAAVLRKVDGLTDMQLRSSMLPSEWTPLELIYHLAHVERRWLQWGFLGLTIDRPWGDWDTSPRPSHPSQTRRSQPQQDPDPSTRHWAVPPEMPAEHVIDFYLAACNRSREIVVGVNISDHSANSDRFRDPANPPTLSWILFHLVQEYARHLGHLDIVRELLDGQAGE